MRGAMASSKTRILIVDDEADLVSVLRIGLEIEGFEVVVAGDGEDGLRKAREERPELVVLDLMLPKLDGYRVCRALKFDERYRNLPIVILSARSGEQDRRLAFDMGADAFVSKPYDMAALVKLVRSRLSATSQRTAA